jgi:dolichol-phosphate mannosyltransferase
MYAYLKNNFLTPRLLKFGIVGASGVIVNMGFLYIFVEFVKLPYFIASLIAIELSIISNFSINLVWTWRDRAKEVSFWTKIFRYHVGAGATAIIGNYLILIGLTEWFGIQYLLSNLIGIAVGTACNFVVNDLWTFKDPAQS